MATINYTATEGNGSTCLSFTHTWIAPPTLAVTATTAPPLAPTTLSASIVEGSVALSWSPGSGDELEFWVERDCGSGFEQIAALPGRHHQLQRYRSPLVATVHLPAQGP